MSRWPPSRGGGRVKVVGYIRVSTEKQADQGLGLEVQERAIQSWARANNHKLLGIYRDEGVSGANGLDHRFGLGEALEALGGGQTIGLVVYRLDRLARDLVLQEQLISEVRRLGGELFSTDGGEHGYLRDDPNEPSRKLIRQVLGAVAEYERAMITLRLRAGRRRKHEGGGFAYGSPPYGWKAQGGELVPDPAEQAGMELARRLRGEGMPLASIGAQLEAQGFLPRRGASWHPTSVKRILERAS
jgi:DNA invertase Pin-like site-specific DNA recombinase